MEEKQIREYINAYSRTREGHPFVDYGNKVKITGNEECPVMVCSLRTQYESRSTYRTIRPYLGGSFGNVTVKNTSDVEPWNMDLEEPQDFTKHDYEYDVEGSLSVKTCDTCSGKGESTCTSCGGKGSDTCPTCHGRKKMDCPACNGSGYQICPECHGEQIISCSKCGGHGTINYKVQEQKYVWDYQQQRQVLKTETVEKTKRCEACSGKGTWRCPTCRNTIEHRGYVRCKQCSNMGYVTCKTCKGNGMLTCNGCSGRGAITCSTCEGHKQMLHGIAVGQHLDEKLQKQYIGDKRVLDLAQKISLYGTNLLKTRSSKLNNDLLPDEPQCNKILNDFMANTGRSDSEILFQEAKVLKCPMQYISYSFNGKSYSGIIHNEVFYPNESPIDDYSKELLDKATRKAERGSSADALRIIDQVEKVGGDTRQLASLREKAEKHLDLLYATGVDIVFWCLALFFTPVLFKFYADINPVAEWAIKSNNTTWGAYNMLPVTQCVLFLIVLFVIRIFAAKRERKNRSYRSIWTYILSGMGKYLLFSAIALAVLVGLNYCGLSIVTSGILTLILKIIALVILMAYWLIDSIIHLIGKIF